MRSIVRGSSFEPARLHVSHRIALVRRRALPLLALGAAEVRAAEAGVAARVGRTAEADLVPRPRMAVEGLACVAEERLPRAAHVEPVPRVAVQLPVRKAVAELDLLQQGQVRERPLALPARLDVEPPRDEPPRLAVVRHVEVLIA